MEQENSGAGSRYPLAGPHMAGNGTRHYGHVVGLQTLRKIVLVI